MSSLPRPLKWPPTFPLEKGLVLWLPFDDRSGARAYDRSMKGNHGTITGATWVAGRGGSALQFVDATTYVTVLDHATLDLTTALTIMLLLKSTKTDAYQRLLWKVAAYGLTTKINTGTLYGTSYIGATPVDSADAPTNVCDGAWHHGCYVHDTLLSANQQKIYVDGLLESQRTIAGSIDVSADNLIFGLQAPNLFTFAGLMTDIRLFNRALTAQEIKRHAKSELLLARH